MRRYLRRAAEKLDRVDPIVVGITGSYGKTSTKSYAGHLLSGTFRVVASPRSFNNRAGLAPGGEREPRSWDGSLHRRDGGVRGR